MTKILLKAVLIVSLLSISVSYVYSETIFLTINNYLNLALENNIELKKAKLSYLREQALVDLQKEVLKPQFSLSSDPLYGFSNSRLLVGTEIKDYYNHNFNLGLALSSIIPTGGTISLSLSDLVSYGTIDKNFTNKPVFSLSLSQPLFVNGGILDERGYKAEAITPGLNREMAQLEMIQSKNQQILGLVNTYYNVIVNERKLKLIRQKVNVYSKELNLFKIQREQGSMSVTDYWEKELEVKDLKKQVFDQEFILSGYKKTLGSLIGLNTLNIDISLKDAIPVIELPKDMLFEETSAYRIGSIKAQLNSLAIQTEMKNYAPTLGFDLSIKPQYSIEQLGSEKFTESVTDLWNSDSWIEYSGSIAFSFPVSQTKQGQLKRAALERNVEIGKLEFEETRITLSDEKNELINKIPYLKAKGRFLSEQFEYSLKRKSEKEQLLNMSSVSALEVEIVNVDVDSTKLELFSNNVEIFLAILEFHNLNGRSIYDLFF